MIMYIDYFYYLTAMLFAAGPSSHQPGPTGSRRFTLTPGTSSGWWDSRTWSDFYPWWPGFRLPSSLRSYNQLDALRLSLSWRRLVSFVFVHSYPVMQSFSNMMLLILLPLMLMVSAIEEKLCGTPIHRQRCLLIFLSLPSTVVITMM